MIRGYGPPNTGPQPLLRRPYRFRRRRRRRDALRPTETGCAVAHPRMSLIRVVAGAHQRPRGDGLEPDLVGSPLQGGELVRVPVAVDREVLLSRAQVLAHGQDLDAVLAQHPEGLHHLVELLTEPDHQPGLGDHLVARHLLRHAQDPRRAQEVGAAPGDRVEPGDGLDVVVEDVRPLGDHLGERHLLAAEVRGENLDLAPGRHPADRADHAHERAGPVVGEIVAVDGGDHRVLQAHPLDLVCDAQRLERVVPGRLAGLDVAEAAAAGADVAEDHEGRRAALPALADVRAVRLLADGVQVVGLDRLLQAAVGRPAGGGNLEPGRLAGAEGNLALLVLHLAPGVGAGAGHVEANVGHRSYRTEAAAPARSVSVPSASTGSRSKISPKSPLTWSM